MTASTVVSVMIPAAIPATENSGEPTRRRERK